MSKTTEEIDLTECDKEPIHIIGKIQDHGLLLVLDHQDLRIVQASENCGEFIGKTCEDLIGNSFLDLVSENHRSDLAETLRNVGPTFSNPLRIPIINASGDIQIFDGVSHLLEDKNEIVVELENGGSPNQSDHPESRQLEHYFRVTGNTIASLKEVESIRDAAEVICHELKSFTGFDRVMLYRFAPDFHGEVIGEAKEDDLEPFLGLHYPATDIPKQARELYVRSPIRLIYDVNSETVELFPADRKLNLSESVLRAVSPIHIQYLKNMGVTSSMSVSLLDGDRLWGLIACHHYSGPHYLSFGARASCVHYGIVVSAQIQTLERHVRAGELADRRSSLVETAKMLARDNLDEAIKQNAPALMRLLRADGLVVFKDDEYHHFGDTPESEWSERLLEKIDDSISDEAASSIRQSDSIPEDFPGLPVTPEATGVLALHFTADWQFLFFRKEYIDTVRWAGKPEDKSSLPAAQQLTPRNSFAEWTEEVKNRCKPWNKIDLSIAEELRSALAAFLVQQNLQLERLNRELGTKNAEIEQFAYTVSHDLKSPLVTVAGYTAALAEDLEAKDYETANDSLRRIASATEKMGNLIEELLTFSRIGKHTAEKTQVDLNVLLHELQDDFQMRFSDAKASLEIADNFPTVKGYRDDLYRVFQNLVDNALKYGSEIEDLRVTIGFEEIPRWLKISVTDNGPGIAPEYHEKIFLLFQRLDRKAKGSGVGLASVTKIVNQHGGKTRVISDENEGATFVVILPHRSPRRKPAPQT